MICFVASWLNAIGGWPRARRRLRPMSGGEIAAKDTRSCGRNLAVETRGLQDSPMSPNAAASTFFEVVRSIPPLACSRERHLSLPKS